MRWTREKPVESGRYLVRSPNGVEFMKHIDITLSVELQDCLFAGPIPDPDPPLRTLKPGDVVIAHLRVSSVQGGRVKCQWQYGGEWHWGDFPASSLLEPTPCRS